MRLHELTWIRALAAHEHMTGAAAELGVPQSTLSRALARIEHELGVPIFERRQSGLATTPLGELVVAAAADVDARLQRLASDLATAQDPDTGVVRLAFLDSAAASLVPRILGRFRAVAPRVQVELTQEPGHRISADLAARRADLALTSVRPDGAYGWLPVREERLALVVPAGHRLAARPEVALEAAAGEQFITTPVGFSYRAQTDAMLAAAGIAPHIAFESEDPSTIEGLVSAGLGVAILPDAYVGASGTVGVRLRGVDARRLIGLTWRTDVEMPRPARRLHALLAAEFATAGADDL